MRPDQSQQRPEMPGREPAGAEVRAVSEAEREGQPIVESTLRQLREACSGVGEAGAEALKICSAGIAAIARVTARKCREIAAHCRDHPVEVATSVGAGVLAGISLPAVVTVETATSLRILYTIGCTSRTVRERLLHNRLHDVFNKCSVGLWVGGVANALMNDGGKEAWAMILVMTMIMKTSLILTAMMRKPGKEHEAVEKSRRPERISVATVPEPPARPSGDDELRRKALVVSTLMPNVGYPPNWQRRREEEQEKATNPPMSYEEWSRGIQADAAKVRGGRRKLRL